MTSGRESLPSGSSPPAPTPVMGKPGPWRGETYYGRPQLKAAPFEPNVVGGYIFLAGLSGAATLLGAMFEATAARRDKRPWARRRPTIDPLVRKSRYLALLAPTIGSALLVYDLHTPQRFYNMMRIAKKTSPMSIGTWILLGFSSFAGIAGGAQMVADMRPRWRWPRRVATAAQVPAAVAGAGLCTYTAALVSATSTPLWAAAPRAIAVRFGSSSIATAAAALALGETRVPVRRALDDLLIAALTVELAASAAGDARYRAAGISGARAGTWGRIETYGATGGGVLLPLALTIGGRLRDRESGMLSRLARWATLAGSAAFRISILGAGADSARRPEISMRFAQPDNLPRP